MLARRALLTMMATGAAMSAAPAMALGRGHTLVVVFQRFAPDWVNMLVPAGDPAYGPARPTLAVKNPLVLDRFFGLNPLLSPLKTIYDEGDLAFVAATGWVDTPLYDRSHFYAQQIAESGAASGVAGGWLARFLAADRYSDAGLWRALAVEKAMPTSLQGSAAAMVVPNFSAYDHNSAMGDAATAAARELARISTPSGQTLLRLCDSIHQVGANAYGAIPPDNGAAYPDSALGQGLLTAAQAIKGNLYPRVITVTSDDDWDTHVNQATRHSKSLPNFADALAAFYTDLGTRMEDVTLLTMCEFGRRAMESAGGTDHGTGSAMLVMSRRIAGAQVYGRWPGMQKDQLWRGDDILPTTDFKSVLSEVLVKHMGLDERTLSRVFPSMYAKRKYWLNFTL